MSIVVLFIITMVAANEPIVDYPPLLEHADTIIKSLDGGFPSEVSELDMDWEIPTLDTSLHEGLLPSSPREQVPLFTNQTTSHTPIKHMPWL